MKSLSDLFKEYYDNHNLGENSPYSSYTKEQLVIESEYMNNTLHRVLEYIDNGGTEINKIRSEIYDGIYDSRI